MNTERHNWSESDEKSLLSTVKWVEDNIPKTAMKDRGGKWNVVAGLLFTDIGLKTTDNACRKRHSDINRRMSETKDVVTFLGVEFPQVEEQTEEDRLRARVAVLERKVDNLVNSLNTFSTIKDDIATLAKNINDNSMLLDAVTGLANENAALVASGRRSFK